MQTATPMLKQYHTVKGKHQDCVLLFRLGDFYEMFYDDAKLVARTLDLVLTARGKGTANNVPMCGFPHHAADNYIARLIKAGHKVAICDQVEDPAQAKGIVRRDVTRIITSGTYLDENSSAARYILALNPNVPTPRNTATGKNSGGGNPGLKKSTNAGSKLTGVAFTDPSTGTIRTNQYPMNPNRLAELIAKLPVYECVYPQSARENIENLFKHPLLKSGNITLSPYEDWCFNPDIAHKSLCEHFGVHNLHGFGIEELPGAASSAGALLEYLKQMNKQPLKHMDRIALYTDEDYVFISPAAYRGLELNALIKTLNHTRTPLGKREFTFRLTHPLKQPEMITQRQEAIKLLKNDSDTTEKLKQYLDRVPDIEKNISRLSCGYTHAKDLLAIRNTLTLLPEIQKLITPFAQQNPLFTIKDIPALREHLQLAVNEDIPLSHPDGKIIQQGYHAELDELRGLQENGRRWLKKLQEEEIKHTGINSLKIGFNKVFGYYIEITKSNLNLVPEEYIRRQTLVNAERFITPELKEYEEKILTARDKILEIENAIVRALRKEILDHSKELHRFCRNIATLDVLYSLTILARSPGYVCPRIADDTLLDIKDGRHPVVEKTSAETFVANDILLDRAENHLIILTGPNMSGKSTYIRQTAILVIMAQVGSFIPAASAHIGVVDKIFTRIGAHDDISRGQSTFMVEMNETADILNNLSERSLIILDEIGRGTGTYDGLSLAWALAEHFQNTKARTLFATHFHELTALADERTGVKNYNITVKEWKDEIIFLHKIIPGGTDDSYGIYVARLAGIPKEVIHRSKQILTQLELKTNLKEQLKRDTGGEEQLSLFSSRPEPESMFEAMQPSELPASRRGVSGKGFIPEDVNPASKDGVAEAIKSVIQEMNINSLTPLEALNKMQELKEMAEKSGNP